MVETVRSKETQTADAVKKAMPDELPDNATEEQKEDYYTKLQAVGITVVKGFFKPEHQANLTGRRPFGGLTTTPYYPEATKVKDNLFDKDEILKKRRTEIGTAVALASQQLWLEQVYVAHKDKITSEDRVNLIRIKNDDRKLEVLEGYLSKPDDKKISRILKGMVTRAKKPKVVKSEPQKEKAPKEKRESKASKAKPVVGRKELDALIKQAETAENQLIRAKADFDKAIEKVKQAQSKLREELKVTKRLMERAG